MHGMAVVSNSSVGSETLLLRSVTKLRAAGTKRSSIPAILNAYRSYRAAGMSQRGKKTFASWIFVYVGLLVAVVLVAQTGSAAPQNTANLSPVVIDGAAPALTIDSLIKRSDI